MVPRALVVLAVLVAPAVATAGCNQDSSRTVTTCDRTPSGGSGTSVSTPAAFAFVGDDGAGAGSLAGARVHKSPTRIIVASFANGLVAAESVVVAIEPRDADGKPSPERTTVTATAAHRGAPKDSGYVLTATVEDAKHDDGLAETVTLFGGGPFLAADASTARPAVRAVALGLPVVLAP